MPGEILTPLEQQQMLQSGQLTTTDTFKTFDLNKQAIQVETNDRIEKERQAESRSFIDDILPAAVRESSNSLVLGYQAITDKFSDINHTPSPTFDIIEHVKLDGLTNDLPYLMKASNDQEYDALKSRLLQHKKDEEVMSFSSWPTWVARVGVDLLDPAWLIPVGGELNIGAKITASAVKSLAAREAITAAAKVADAAAVRASEASVVAARGGVKTAEIAAPAVESAATAGAQATTAAVVAPEVSFGAKVAQESGKAAGIVYSEQSVRDDQIGSHEASIENALIAGAIGGVFIAGGKALVEGGGFISSKGKEALTTAIENEVKGLTPSNLLTEGLEREVPESTLESTLRQRQGQTAAQTEQVTNKAQDLIAKVPGADKAPTMRYFDSPVQLLQNSEMHEIREATAQIATTNNVTKGAQEGLATALPAEDIRQMSFGSLSKIFRGIKELKKELARPGGISAEGMERITEDLKTAGYKTEGLTQAQVLGNLGAVVRMAADTAAEHPVAGIERIAKQIREKRVNDMMEQIKASQLEWDRVAPAALEDSQPARRIAQLQSDLEDVKLMKNAKDGQGNAQLSEDGLKSLAKQEERLNKEMADAQKELAKHQEAIKAFENGGKDKPVVSLNEDGTVPRALTWQWDTGAIRLNKQSFVNALRQDFKTRFNDMTSTQADIAANAIADRLTGIGRGTNVEVLKDIAKIEGLSGRAASRVYDITPSVAEPYLIQDIGQNLGGANKYVWTPLAYKQATGFNNFAELEAQKLRPGLERAKAEIRERLGIAGPPNPELMKLAEAGDVEAAAKLAAQEQLHAAKMAAEDPVATALANKEIARLEANYTRDISLLKRISDRYSGDIWNGSFTDSVQAAKEIGLFTRQWIGLTTLGATVLSSLSDIAGIMRVYGLGEITSALGQSLNKQFRNVSWDTAEQIGIAHELAQHNIARQQMNIIGAGVTERELEQRARGAIGTVQHAMDAASEKYQFIIGAKLWNDATRTFESILSQNRILRNAKAGWENVSAADKQFLAIRSIGKEQLDRIGKQFDQGPAAILGFGRNGDFYQAQFEHWVGEEGQIAAKDLQLAMLRSSRGTIPTASVGLLPEWADSELGKIVSQFTTFMYATNQQFIRAGLQDPTMRFGGAVAAAVGLNMLGNKAKDVLAGRDPNQKKENYLTKIMGIDSTKGPVEHALAQTAIAVGQIGLLGIPGEYAGRAVEAVSDIHEGKYEKPIVSILGPTGAAAIKVEKAARATGKLVTGQSISDSESKSMIGLVPGNQAGGLHIGELVSAHWHDNHTWQHMKQQLGAQ